MDAIGAITTTDVNLQRLSESSPVPVRRDEKSSGSATAPGTVREVDQEEVSRAAERVNEALNALDRNLKVSVHKDTGQLIVRVTDPKSGKLIRQIPAEQLLDAEVNIKKVVGLFVNDKA
ncbi:MAG: flagellar protein FlaG [Candidatus Latescibacteria bacterium]|nr:flagellar protein FlaG [Candidatus Latescibacterota bacterium]